MKHIRILSLSLALVLMLSLLAACGKSGAGSESISDAQSSASTSQPGADVSAPNASQPEEIVPDVSTPVTPEPDAVQTLTLNKSDFTLKAADAAYKLRATVTGVDNATVIWSSSDETIATVSENGTVTAVAPGTATVTAAVEGTELTAKCVVRVSFKIETTPEEPAPEVKPEEKPEEPAPAKVDLAAFFETIFTDPANAPALIPMEADALDAFYAGLTAIATNQRVAYMPMMTAVPCEIVMVECANAADVEAVKTIFQARIDAQVNDHFNYPMVIEAWEKEAKVVSNGNFVALFVVSGMTDEVVSNFNALF